MRSLRILGLAFLALVAVVVVAYGAIVLTAGSRYQRTWAAHDTGFPIPFALTGTERASLVRERIAAGAPAADPLAGVDLAAAARDSAVVRGAHLVNSRVGCNTCHGPDLGGGVIIDVPMVGYWAAPNLTTGEGSVTRGFTAHDWDLAVRHAIRSNGRTSSMPSADFVNLSDRELSDIVCYIRSMPPVDRRMAPVRFGPVLSVLVATDPAMLSAFRIDHQKPHVVEPPPAAPTPEFGEHIAQVCRGCHGDHLSGGKVKGDPNMPLVADITPDPSGLAGWSEADFMRAMHEGKRPDGSAISTAMPWQSFRQMDDVELKALWAYLRTVPAVPKGNH